ncbi:HlyD family efflux transporter periplasmic adaptor subunit [Mucilaginibacter limnophilus]|uniref:HlyD family efflux transporter periplasmic adaptor subunit n=1 Tax=Mucilaginibacter limnophilus TaxID=1932778 RepID=A0A437MYY7_9SPHI|nr:HlyD family efflux transporter periplasmic adaptor subunit [Mucilaginibacter limnophilus]RVU02826.1 HlyD family efflux transporter periplasmic adaptor subunit [Mucilaginibacter limnophilus]
MDTVIDAEIIQKRKKKKIIWLVLIVALLIISVLLVRSVFNSTISKSQFTTGVVEISDIENTISANGEVLPEFEEVITSPVNAAIKTALMDAGKKVKPGQPILVLDKSATENEYIKLNFQLETKRNEIRKLKLDLNKSFYDIQSNNSIKQLRISSLQDAVENAKRLFKAGGGTREDIEQAELNLKVALLEKKQLENEIKSKQQTMQVEVKEAEIAAAIQQNDLAELQRKLKLADVSATREGVVTYINKNTGASVHEGDVLVRIADLGSFKVSGTISDNYLDQLHVGMPVIIRVNDIPLRGHVANVYPSVQNGTVSFDVQLDERNNKLFRPNMKVDTYLVTDAHSKIMRLPNGAALKGLGKQDVFVVNKGKAVRRTVTLGMSNFDYVEIVDGLKPGEVVITSDMSEYKNAKEITIEE